MSCHIYSNLFHNIFTETIISVIYFLKLSQVFYKTSSEIMIVTLNVKKNLHIERSINSFQQLRLRKLRYFSRYILRENIINFLKAIYKRR